MDREKINVVAHNSFQLSTFCLNNSLMMSQVRHIRSPDNLFGVWRGRLIILEGAENKAWFDRMMLEAQRRGLVISRMGAGDRL